MDINTFLSNLGIKNHPGLKVAPEMEGYSNYTFGCHAGITEPNVEDLAHELAHASQFGPRYFDKRANEDGFVFKRKWKRVLGTYCIEPRTLTAILRELDTFAYQAHLFELAEYKINKEEFFGRAGRLMVMFMSDSFLVPGRNDKEQMQWCTDRAFEYYSRRKPETVLKRLIKWLDLTESKLNAQPAPS